ncbi:septation protein SepH [Nocardiopsis exhalans]|uniref:Septation protein SepH n=1 Tax=Nocardiopsis exhalans TaxID=163604 RepID=A0ABY5D0J4_9ACTN|nr:septation protein SepH [Nocardiopsis exhalans]USY17744.1 septation protein SepH [Nocardiopsis exhalans]
MHELRLVAVSEDGTYLVLASTGRGTRFMLPVDDRLRAAVRGQFSRLGQYEIEVENPLRPKEIQARIRSGETAEAISEISGIPIERVRWFEGPVLQEREYIAQQAQRATVRSPNDASPGPSLGDLVTKRIGAHQLETGDAAWDSWKREDRSWQLKLVFLHGGDERVAHWLYEPRHNSVTPADEEAARFSSNEPLDAAPAPGTNVTPFTPRRNEAATDLPRLDAQSAAERRPDHVAPRRLSPAQDTPLDEPLRPVARRPETDQFGVPLREERQRQAPPEPEPAPRRPLERPSERFAERRGEAPPAAPLPQTPRPAAPRSEPAAHQRFADPVEAPPAHPEPRRYESERYEPEPRRQFFEEPGPVAHEASEPSEPRHPEPGRPEPRQRPAAPDWLDARPAPIPDPEPQVEPEEVPAAEETQQRPRRRRATIDLNDKGTPRRAAEQAPPTAPAVPAAANGSPAGGAAKRKGRGRRASVPSWDEIMFGSKKND